MILGTMQEFKERPLKGQKTFFVEKIWQSFTKSNDDILLKKMYHSACKKKNGTAWNIKEDGFLFPPKLHSFRMGSRWKAGMKIHFAINSRTKRYFRYAPIINCVSVQRIFIEHEALGLCRWARIYIDGVLYGTAYWAGGHTFDYHLKIETLAKNDGFDSVRDFFHYFNKNFDGQIVHWTNLRYE